MPWSSQPPPIKKLSRGIRAAPIACNVTSRASSVMWRRFVGLADRDPLSNNNGRLCDKQISKSFLLPLIFFTPFSFFFHVVQRAFYVDISSSGFIFSVEY